MLDYVCVDLQRILSTKLMDARTSFDLINIRLNAFEEKMLASLKLPIGFWFISFTDMVLTPYF